jgi:hypothetical protein
MTTESHPLEIILDHPVEDAGIRYERLVIANFGALARYESHNVHRVIHSFARIYGVPRRVIRKVRGNDTVHIGALVLALRDELGLS